MGPPRALVKLGYATKKYLLLSEAHYSMEASNCVSTRCGEAPEAAKPPVLADQ